MSSKRDIRDIFNSPFFWVDEFINNNYTYTFSSSIVAHKPTMYRRYKEYAIKYNKGELTLQEFHNEVIKIFGN